MADYRFNQLKAKEYTGSSIEVDIQKAVEGEYTFFGTDIFIMETLYALGQSTWTITGSGIFTKDDPEVELFKVTNIKGALEVLRKG